MQADQGRFRDLVELSAPRVTAEKRSSRSWRVCRELRVAAPHMTIAPARSAVSPLDPEALFKEARRRRRRRRFVAGITIATAVVVVAALMVLVSTSSPSERGVAPVPSHRGVGTFTSPTGVALVFADGLTLDLDRRTAIARAIPGQRLGDQRWPIIRAGNSFVVGWGKVWASPIDGGSARLIGPVVTSLPAAESGEVWLVDYPGGRIGEGTPTLSEVTMTGSVVRSELGPPPSSGVPIVGVPGGLAFETSTGIALWSFDHHAFIRQLEGTGPGYIGNAAAGSVAWCDNACLSVHVTALAGADRTFSLPRAGWIVEPDTVRLSPDGRYVAVVATRGPVGTANPLGSLDLIDIRTGRVDVEKRISEWTSLAWTSNSKELFFASNTLSNMTVGEIMVRKGLAETARIPARDTWGQFVVVNRSAVRALIGRAVQGPPSACPAFGVASGTRTCAYTY